MLSIQGGSQNLQSDNLFSICLIGKGKMNHILRRVSLILFQRRFSLSFILCFSFFFFSLSFSRWSHSLFSSYQRCCFVWHSYFIIFISSFMRWFSCSLILAFSSNFEHLIDSCQFLSFKLAFYLCSSLHFASRSLRLSLISLT